MLPSWFLFSIPAALWMYSTVSWFQLVWGDTRNWFWLGWISLVLFMGMLSEVGQHYGLVPGTFEMMDAVFYFGAWLLAITLVNSRRMNAAE